MGNFKPTHLRMLMSLPEVSSQWEEKYGRPWNEDDFEAVLATFRPLMSKYIVDEDLAKPIDGAVECIEKLRAAGVQRWEITEEMHSNEENTHKTLIITGVGI